MKIGITKFIPENIAPPNAKNLAIFNGSKKVCTVDISKMKPSNIGNKLYSFGLVSDMHVDNSTNTAYLSEAMTFFENQGCLFCCHAGDITSVGFYTETDKTNLYTVQFANFKSVIDAHPNLPMHGICGNHESYYKPIIYNEADLEYYTGRKRLYTMTQGNDVFVFWGQPGGTGYVEQAQWVEDLEWLNTTLEANKNKRCFVFSHLTLSDDSGNPNDIHNAYMVPHEDEFIAMMQTYKNAMLFHGHSHLDLNEQYNFSYSNISTKKGFISIHVPSSCGGRITSEGVLIKTADVEKRGGYIAEVYENCIILKGYYFRNSEAVPIAQYCIDTTLQIIKPNTFTDSTGVINV